MGYADGIDPRKVTPKAGQSFRSRIGSLPYDDGKDQFLVHVCAPDANLDDPLLVKEIITAYKTAEKAGKGPVKPAPELAQDGVIPQMMLLRSEAGNLMLRWHLDHDKKEWDVPVDYDRVYTTVKQEPRAR